MYVENSLLTKSRPFHIPSGNQLVMYCSKSMEDNPNAAKLIAHARNIGFESEPYMLIEQVSGPVIEKCKEDFLVKLILINKAKSTEEKRYE